MCAPVIHVAASPCIMIRKLLKKRFCWIYWKQITWEEIFPSDILLPTAKETTLFSIPLPFYARKKKNIRRLWNLAGGISVGVGVLGVLSPVAAHRSLVPTGRFLLLERIPRFYNRLISFGPLGRLIDNFQKGKGLPVKTKRRAIVFMWFSIVTSMIFFLTGTTLRLVLFLVGIVVTLYILRIKTADPLIAAPERRGIPAKTH